MFLSRLLLNSRSTRAWKDIASPYELHRTILRAYPGAAEGGPRRVLFRVEPLQNTSAIPVIVQSDLRPEWGRLCVTDDYYWDPDGRRAAAVEAKEVHLGVTAGQVLRFRLRANPTKKNAEGRRLGLLQEPDQLMWLSRKGQAGGFRPVAASVVNEGIREIGGGNAPGAYPIRMLSVLFDGRIAVTEPVAFVRTVEDGVGSGKGFGFGLLSIARA